MDWDELVAEILAEILVSPLEPGELVYLARTGNEYTWCVVVDPTQPPHTTPGVPPPDSWIYYSGPWLATDEATAFFTDLRAELESMTGHADRCRWPLDEPWPHGH